MAMLLRAAGLRKAFLRPLFSGVSIVVEDAERLALIGPNGSGKSTLLKILAGLEPADEGELTRRRGLRWRYVAQNDAFEEGATALSAVASSVMELRPEHVHDEHEAETHARMALDMAGFPDPDQPAAAMSGGWRKRLAIVRALACEPDLLMLDEPTNHLDLEGILWLEDEVKRGAFATVFVSHDRLFLDRVSSRVVELSRAYPSGTFSSSGGYDQFLSRREDFLLAQEKEQQSLKGIVQEDLRWLSRGAKARRTKSKSRIQAASERREQLSAMRERTSAAQSKAAGIDFSATGRQTHRLLRARRISKSYADHTLFRDLSLTLSPGSCLGLLGPNGSGKTTLIRVLTGQEQPDAPAGDEPSGIDRADNLRTVVFTQRREALDPTHTLQQALWPTGDGVIYRGQTMHINTWAQRFLFRPEQLKSPVKELSGGEQARVVIAKMMLESADVLILDEPTNDLDISSLEVLEESLEDFPGAILLVTHDRAMLDRLSTEILALDGRGGWATYAELSQWENAQRDRERDRRSAGNKPKDAPAPSAPQATASPKSKKLPYHEQREWDGMEAAIAKAEAEAEKLDRAAHDPAVMSDHKKSQAAFAALEAAHAAVARLYDRWAELEAKQK
ncbi:MAG: ABC-F family ATP-binding cassette domain-containing protein [Planctomycetes bacterium]|nr:ABC-F family ATP-binding cassette domain-containing protein [Planctomycetota bacterium]